jgi:hypothetical protein
VLSTFHHAWERKGKWWERKGKWEYRKKRGKCYESKEFTCPVLYFELEINFDVLVKLVTFVDRKYLAIVFVFKTLNLL